ncbi:MAG: PH domain-containing protein [Flavisolibacter sp.]
METEKIIHQTCPSQVRNLLPFIISVLLAAAIVTAAILAENNLILIALVLPVLYGFWKWLEIKTTKLTITDERIIVSEGILNKTTNETELYRVRDTTIKEPFFYRIFGLGTIVVFTTDEANATHNFIGYKKPHWVKDQIRNYSEICRQKKRWGTDNILLHDHNV